MGWLAVSDSARRQVEHVDILVHNRAHLDAEGLEFHADTGEYGDAFAQIGLNLIAIVATKSVEVLKRVE